MEIKTKTSITDMTSDGIISVLMQTYIEFNGQETVLENHQETLVPGQFERAKEILPDNQYNAVLALWTGVVTAAWMEKRHKLEAECPS